MLERTQVLHLVVHFDLRASTRSGHQAGEIERILLRGDRAPCSSIGGFFGGSESGAWIGGEKRCGNGFCEVRDVWLTLVAPRLKQGNKGAFQCASRLSECGEVGKCPVRFNSRLFPSVQTIHMAIRR
jgi:hypothetical protein